MLDAPVLLDTTEVVDVGPVVTVEFPLPVPTLVVIGPLSMYTPLIYQSSGAPPLTMRNTPTWKSSELVDVEAEILSTTLVSAEEPVDAQSPTVLALNYANVNFGKLGRKRNSIAAHVNLIGEVEPGASGEWSTPLGVSTDMPLKVRGCWADAVFQLIKL